MVVVAVKEQNQFEMLQRLEYMLFKKVIVIDNILRDAVKIFL